MLLPLVPVSLPEDLRPQFHFTAPKGWLNDPNGLVYENGNYHLFYQHNPFGTEWGNMTWGHAVSRDLLHWKDLPNALEPDSLGTMFSGSAIYDAKGKYGFGAKGKPTIVCFYTAAGGTNEASKGKPFTQCLAWSQDGLTFTKLDSNPIVGNLADGNRDPKVIWDRVRKQWVMALYLIGGRYCLLGSHDLRNWTKLSEISTPGTDECPDFFPLRLGGKSGLEKWIFWGANGRYMVGAFDGKDFHPETPVLATNFGNTGYAAQIYSNTPGGRTVQIAWLNNSNFPGCAWNQQMGIPVELNLKATPQGPRLSTLPVREVRSLRKVRVQSQDGVYSVPTGLVDIEGVWSVPASGRLTLRVNGVSISVDAATKRLSALDRQAEVDLTSGKLKLRILADRASIEIFAQDGLVTMPLFVLPVASAFRGVQIERLGQWNGRPSVYELKSARQGS
ncbi:MAG: glycoside hydrolase family 32 protein [Fimbriimonas sp.]